MKLQYKILIAILSVLVVFLLGAMTGIKLYNKGVTMVMKSGNALIIDSVKITAKFDKQVAVSIKKNREGNSILPPKLIMPNDSVVNISHSEVDSLINLGREIVYSDVQITPDCDTLFLAFNYTTRQFLDSYLHKSNYEYYQVSTTTIMPKIKKSWYTSAFESRWFSFGMGVLVTSIGFKLFDNRSNK